MIRVGVVGGTGYTGMELLRLILGHPQLVLAEITSRGEAGTRVDALWPSLRGQTDLSFQEPDAARLRECDVVFFATPNGIAMESAPELLAAGCRVIDLGADFRLRDVRQWQTWYGVEHACPELLSEAVYGLPEIDRGAIRKARLVANPGCYPTAITLGLLPLLEAGYPLGAIVADCKSGVSGAGRAAKVATLLCEANESFKAYGASGHRHLPEIEQTLTEVSRRTLDIVFVPHLVPMTRGMQATLHVAVTATCDELTACYQARYAEEPFVDVLAAGSHPETRWVRGTNRCHIALHQPPGREDRVIVLAVIDNLTKGAAGQAIQNLNLMFGLDERLGLEGAAVLP
ncbi:N-acetyl-gamma-glutamyl-phosphate reductase [Halorhodospira abdelmalekii]|uniref:N-acetyl-gamma-glutamyl-phosphate reductase n=1 Tax=Halorhodospira abdelmalekii TaxID=421629 RepID=UPI001907AD27|nr:N-acetyl-gamma-glutamyl-phosphate reductase [Halorhodospira abdelmalekii]MBK1736023.1 N-acetyl-gamma-glutamyl-phosphate reductase [Halorhodospira abdelmalekii]